MDNIISECLSASVDRYAAARRYVIRQRKSLPGQRLTAINHQGEILERVVIVPARHHSEVYVRVCGVEKALILSDTGLATDC